MVRIFPLALSRHKKKKPTFTFQIFFHGKDLWTSRGNNFFFYDEEPHQVRAPWINPWLTTLGYMTPNAQSMYRVNPREASCNTWSQRKKIIIIKDSFVLVGNLEIRILYQPNCYCLSWQKLKVLANFYLTTSIYMFRPRRRGSLVTFLRDMSLLFAPFQEFHKKTDWKILEVRTLENLFSFFNLRKLSYMNWNFERKIKQIPLGNRPSWDPTNNSFL